MKLRSEYLFCQLMPPAEHQGPAQLTLSNTDNLLLPSFLTPLLNRTHLLPLLLSCRAPSDLSSLFVAHFLRSTPFTAMVFRARSWVIFSLHPSLTLDHLIPSQRNNADNHPLLNSHLQHRPLPESQNLRSIGYQPSTPGCPPGTKTQHLQQMVPQIPHPYPLTASAVICLRAFFGHQNLHCLPGHQAKSAGD